MTYVMVEGAKPKGSSRRVFRVTEPVCSVCINRRFAARAHTLNRKRASWIDNSGHSVVAVVARIFLDLVLQI